MIVMILLLRLKWIKISTQQTGLELVVIDQSVPVFIATLDDFVNVLPIYYSSSITLQQSQ